MGPTDRGLIGARVLVMLAALALLAAACGGASTNTGIADAGATDAGGDGSDPDSGSGDGSGDEGEGEGEGNGEEAGDGSSGDGSSGDGSSGDGEGGSSAGSGGHDGDGSGSGDGSDDDGEDLAEADIDPYEPASFDPPGDVTPIPLLLFNNDGAYTIDQGGVGATQVIDGQVTELSHDGAGGFLFQTEPEDQVVWWLAAGAVEPADLLVTEDPVHLVLEGISGHGDDRRVIYQRRARTGVPDTAEDTLRAYRIYDGAIFDLGVVGGWEAGTVISSVANGIAAGVWSGEGYSRYFVLDVDNLDTPGEGLEDHWQDFVGFEATWHGTGLLALGLVYNEAGGYYDQMGLARVDLDNNVLEMVALFPWDNGYWYPEALFVDRGFAVISRNGDPDLLGNPDPLGPIMVDLVTGESITLRHAAYPRPNPA